MQNECILNLSQMTNTSFLRFGHNTKLWVGKNAFSHCCYTIGEYSEQTPVLFT